MKSGKFWGVLSIALMGLIFITTLASNINLESSQGLWIDEEITFYPIQKIIRPYDLSEFWWLISEGGDYRYGRSLWNMMAAASYFPTMIWGPVGQIIAGRQLQVLLLLLSFWLLSKTFLQNDFLRFLLILTLCCIPYSSYYMSMPKPEPELLFFGSLFLYFYLKRAGSLQGLYWIFLGLALGSKISFLPPTLLLLGLSIYLEIKKNKWNQIFSKISHSLLYICTGICLAIPIFFELAIILLYPALVLIFIFNVLQRKYAFLLTFVLIALIGILIGKGVIAPLNSVNYLEFLQPIKFWYLSTLGSVNEGGIGANYNLINWLAFIPRQWLKAPFPLGFFYMSILGYCILMCGNRVFQLVRHREVEVETLLSTALLIIGIAMLASPMTAVKNRLWGMYLYPGFIFLLTYFFSCLDRHLKQSRNEPITLIKDNFSIIGQIFSALALLCYALATAPAQLLSSLSVLNYLPSLNEICKSNKFNNLWNKNIYSMALIIAILYTLIMLAFFWIPSWASDLHYMTFNTEKYYSRPWLIGM